MLRPSRSIAICCILGLGTLSSPLVAATDERANVFAEKVATTLQTQCVRCHGPQLDESGLRLDRPEALRIGGDRGPAVVPGSPERSWLYRAILADDDELQMPPDGNALPDDIVASFRQWIEAGAIWPAEIPKLSAQFVIRDEDREHWSFVRPTNPALPSPANDDWSINEVDRFVRHRMLAAGVRPAPAADRRTIIRRLYFDLIGRPPAPSDVQAFIDDPRTDAYERLVEDLLERPEYGQRWARLWLDLVRYAESDGFKADVYRPNAWIYRDYVVRSLNEDKPYDRFLQEQLAGDELFPDDTQARIATGYLRLWPLEDNQKDVQRQWTLVLDDITEVTSEAMLGLGIRCAKCHDHKYDPIPQVDYFRMRAFFAALLPRDDVKVPLHNDKSSGLAEWEEQTRSIRTAMRKMESRHVASRKSTIDAYPPYLQVMYSKRLEDWTPLDHQYNYLARPQIEKKSTEELEFEGDEQAKWLQLREQLEQRESQDPRTSVTAMTVTDVGSMAPPTYRANDPALEEIAPGFLSVLDPTDAVVEPLPCRPHSTGRRAAFARWLTQPDHPLTARVMVNRIWQQHFGRGIVATANDFGRQGTPPTHPDLLDWLARRFVAQGWSLKALHRLMVTSATYRQATLRQTSDFEQCQELFCGYLPRRLDAEQIRDAMLATSGELQPYGSRPSVNGDETVPSIMVRNIRNRPDEWLNAFDAPDMFNSCARRFVTTTPLQALLVINSTWSLDRARTLAHRIRALASNDTGQAVKLAYQRIFSRDPNGEELQIARDFLEREDSSVEERWTDFCHVMLCSNEFVYVD